MGLRRRLGSWFGGRKKTEPFTPEERRARAEEARATEERRVLDEMHRQCAKVHADLRRTIALLPTDDRPEIPPEPPRFATYEEGRAYMERIRAVLKR